MGVVDTIDLAKNLNTVKQRMDRSCRQSGIAPSELRLIAVSKGQSITKIKELVSLGVMSFGENYLDELIKKSVQLKDEPIDWIFIGALQSNKIKRIVKIASEIQTIASLKHAHFINRYAKEFNKIAYPVYICVNAGKEETKSGVFMEDVASLAEQIEGMSALSLQGIMAIPPKQVAVSKDVRSILAFYDELKKLSQSVGCGHLSLGMSADFEKAIVAGATSLRIGRALFGERK